MFSKKKTGMKLHDKLPPLQIEIDVIISFDQLSHSFYQNNWQFMFILIAQEFPNPFNFGPLQGIRW